MGYASSGNPPLKKMLDKNNKICYNNYRKLRKVVILMKWNYFDERQKKIANDELWLTTIAESYDFLNTEYLLEDGQIVAWRYAE